MLISHLIYQIGLARQGRRFETASDQFFFSLEGSSVFNKYGQNSEDWMNIQRFKVAVIWVASKCSFLFADTDDE